MGFMIVSNYTKVFLNVCFQIFNLEMFFQQISMWQCKGSTFTVLVELL